MVLKNAGLSTFLGLVKDVAKEPVSFDLTTMACPFGLRWTLGRPVIKNGVEELDAFMKDKIRLYTEGAKRLGLGKK